MRRCSHLCSRAHSFVYHQHSTPGWNLVLDDLESLLRLIVIFKLHSHQAILVCQGQFAAFAERDETFAGRRGECGAEDEAQGIEGDDEVVVDAELGEVILDVFDKG